MGAAAVLSVQTRLASLKHVSALTTDQFQLLKARAKKGLVTDQVFENLNQGSGNCGVMARWTRASTRRTCG